MSNKSASSIRLVSYEALSEALKRHPGAASASATFGILYGVLSGPLPPLPSIYLPVILGDEPFETESQIKQTLDTIMLLHNDIAQAVNLDQEIEFRAIYPATFKGAVQQASDLQEEIEGFKLGLELGGVAEDWLNTYTGKWYEQLTEIDITLEEIQDYCRKKMRRKDRGETDSMVIAGKSNGKVISQLFCNISRKIGPQRREALEELRRYETEPRINTRSKVGRNDPCPCGSGKKFKRCHGKDDVFTIH